MATPQKLQVVIVGAGIAGLAAAVGLKEHPNIEVKIYEKAKQLEEIGASIALGPNGMRTLERLGVHNALDNSVAFRNPSGFPMIYRHWQTNDIVSVDSYHGQIEPRHGTARFYRPHLQEALLSHIPASTVRLNKTFSSVLTNDADGRLTITFTDGSTVVADILLGADGINSAVRRNFVPGSSPKWTGWVAFRSVFDVKLLQGLDSALEEANHWWGPDRTFFASRLGKDLFTIVGGYYSDPDAPDAPYRDAIWNSDGDVKVLQEYYKDWHPEVRKMVEATPCTRQYPNTAAPGIDTWSYEDGRVTLAGDAAHAHGGALATGGSLALDDAYAFAAALWHVFPPDTPPATELIPRALSLYEKSRKPHVDRVISTVHEGNEAIIARIRKPRETDKQLRTRLKNRKDPYWIHEHDVESALAQAIKQDTDDTGPASKL